MRVSVCVVMLIVFSTRT